MVLAQVHDHLTSVSVICPPPCLQRTGSLKNRINKNSLIRTVYTSGRTVSSTQTLSPCLGSGSEPGLGLLFSEAQTTTIKIPLGFHCVVRKLQP